MAGLISDGRRGAAAIAVGILALALLAVGAIGVAHVDAAGKAKAKKTYGIASKVNKKKGSIAVAVKKPKGKYISKTSFDLISVKKLKKIKGWGKDGATAKAGKVKICDLEGKKKTNCSTAGGSLTFDFLERTKCKVGSGKKAKKKKVYLYGRSTIEQDPTKNFPSGRGIALQYGYDGTPAACPKF